MLNCEKKSVLLLENLKNMKIAYIYPAFINIGGADKIIISKANYMADSWGYEVYLITDSQNGLQPFFPLSEKVHLIDLDINFFQQYQYGPLKRLMVYLRLMRKYKQALTNTFNFQSRRKICWLV